MGYFASKYGNQSIAPIQSMLPKKPLPVAPKKQSILQNIFTAIKNAPKKNIQQAGKAVMGVSKVGQKINQVGAETLLGIAKGMASAPARTVVTGQNVIESVAKLGGAGLLQATGQKAKAKKLISQINPEKTRKLPFLGDVKPVTMKKPLDVLGTGLDLGTLIAPFGKAGVIAAQGAIGGLGAELQKDKPTVRGGILSSALGAGAGYALGKVLKPKTGENIFTKLKYDEPYLTPMGKITKTAKVVKPSIVKNIIEQGAKQTERIAPQAAKAMRSIDISKQAFSSLDDVVKTIKTAIGKQGDDVIGAATRYADNYAQMLKDPDLAKKAAEQLFEVPTGGIKPPSVPPKIGGQTPPPEVIQAQPKVKGITDILNKWKTNFTELVQNTDERVRQLVDRPDVKVSDISNPYQKMTQMSGKIGAKIEQGYSEAKSVFDDMAKLGSNIKTTRKEVSDYLLFRHAPERNIAIGENAAGITTKAAREGLQVIEASPRGQQIKIIADKVQSLNSKVLDMLKDSGVISDDLYKTLRTKYKNHIPLQRIFEETENVGQVLSGKGLDVRSTGIKAAKGSERQVDDILTNVMTNYEQAVLRSEKNIVDQATLKFVRDNKNVLGDLFTEIHPKSVGTSFQGTPLLERTTDPSILQMFENGKRVWIKINDPKLAIAIKGIGREKLPTIFNAVGTFTRLYSGLATRFNPEFVLSNKLRDLQEMTVFLSSQKGIGAKGAAKAALKDPISMKAVWDSIRGIDSEGARLYNEMKSLGGTTGGFGLSTKSKVSFNLEKMEKLATSKTKRLANNLLEYVDNWNTLFEDSTRLSVFKEALASGKTKDQAAFLAKEATINFNRMGKGGPVINALYMFSNASIQGTYKMLKSFKNPKVLAGTIATVGASVAAVNQWNDRVDPDWRGKVSKWDRLNSLPIMIPTTNGGARYISIPVSWGLKPIKVMSDYAYDATTKVGIDGKRMLGDLATAITEAYNPAGGTDIVSAITPTILDMPSEISRNRGWFGSSIKPTKYDPNMPEDIRYFSSLSETKTGQTAISISEALQSKAGIAVSPADIKYAFEQYVGGAGRSIGKTFNALSGIATGKPLPLDEYPFLSRFYRQKTQEEIGDSQAKIPKQKEALKSLLEDQSRERFKMKQEADRIDAELSDLPEEEANARFKEIKKENPLLAEKIKDSIDERKLGLTSDEKKMKMLGVENGERAKYVNDLILTLSTEEEQNAYYKELKSKKIITEEVAKQIKKLLGK